MEEIYIVTGAFGHLGINLVNKLLSLNKRVVAFDMRINDDYLKSDDVSVVAGDVCKREDIANLLEKYQDKKIIFIHCAGIVSIASKYDQHVYDVNVNGTKNIVDNCIEHHVDKLVYISSVHAIPEGKKGSIIQEISDFDDDKVFGLYAKTKALATKYVLDHADKLDVRVIHPSGIIGINDYNIGHTTRLIIDYANHRLTAAINGGYDFVDVRDVCAGIIACINKGRSGEGYILSNRFITVKEILDTLHDITGQKIIKTYLPLWFIKPLAPFAEIYYKLMKTKPLFTGYSLYTLNSNANFSHEKASRELDYHPRELKDTLSDTYEWLKEKEMIKIKK